VKKEDLTPFVVEETFPDARAFKRAGCDEPLPPPGEHDDSDDAPEASV